MQLDLGVLYVGDRPIVLTLEPIGDDKVRVNMSSWTDVVVIRAERPAAYLNLDMSGMTDAGYGPVMK